MFHEATQIFPLLVKKCQALNKRKAAHKPVWQFLWANLWYPLPSGSSQWTQGNIPVGCCSLWDHFWNQEELAPLEQAPGWGNLLLCCDTLQWLYQHLPRRRKSLIIANLIYHQHWCRQNSGQKYFFKHPEGAEWSQHLRVICPYLKTSLCPWCDKCFQKKDLAWATT